MNKYPQKLRGQIVTGQEEERTVEDAEVTAEEDADNDGEVDMKTTIDDEEGM
jgi:hypothetical protein